MSLYILPQNQKIIWDTISKVPLFQKLCNETHNGEQWFQNVIQIHYNKIQNNHLNKDDLRHLNKETIQYMLHDLKNKYSLQPATSNDFFNNNSSLQNNNYNAIQTNTSETRGYILEQKQNTINNQFQKRQEEFGSLLNRPAVKEIDFRENVSEDKPIENMDELIQRQLKEREYDIQPKKIEQEENIDIGAVELTEKESKSVKWQDEQIVDKYNELKNTLDNFMEKMTKEINEIKQEIIDLKKEKKHIFDENSTERMKTIMSKLQTLEKQNEKMENKIEASDLQN
jgi:hypothetical protein